MKFDKFLETIYNENDLSKGLSFSLAGILALIVYKLEKDVFIAIVVPIIFFPIFRFLIKSIIEHLSSKKALINNQSKLDDILKNISEEEQSLIYEFVSKGSSSLHISDIRATHEIVNSLENRGYIHVGDVGWITLEIDIFDQARIYFKDYIPF